jgi:hypothetical protein
MRPELAVVTRDEWARIKGIVSGALARPDADRARYLSAECGVDETLRGAVESLLAAAVRAADLYEDPTVLTAGARPTVRVFEQWPGPSSIVRPGETFLEALAERGFAGTDRYQIRRRIGAGGMGVVYEVEDRVRREIVALKTLRRWHPADIYRLKREFRSLADIAHPNLASLYDLVADEHECFFTMELVDGWTLVDYLRAGRTGEPAPSLDRLWRALPHLIAGVSELHRRATLHRDLKPSNILVTPAGRVVILDFGVTSAAASEHDLERGVAGTPAYLSPEQCAGRAATEASDWYSVGATLYHALTGHPPFEGSLGEVMARKIVEDPVHVSALVPAVPRDLADACMALLSRDPPARLDGLAALRRLAGPIPDAVEAGIPAAPVFVGREGPLEAVTAAFAAVRQERRGIVVAVHGPSGIGKTALLQRFLEREATSRGALVLRSRCHEHEAVPYQGLDAAIDGLSRHLSRLPLDDLASLIPPDAAALARLFPVMQILAAGPSAAPDIADPVELRRRAFGALRDLVGRLAARRPLVIEIDDFHWADADSAASLAALLKPPDPPPFLLLIAFRTEEIEAKPFLRTLIENADMWARIALPLVPLTDSEVQQLMTALLPPGAPLADEDRRAIARDAGGNPLLVTELTRPVILDGPRPARGITEALERRLETLPPESRTFLDALAVCGRPVPARRVFEACGLSGDERPLVARLQAAHFLRRSRAADHVEVYHDRIREGLARRVPPETARQIHERIVQILQAHGDDEPDVLFEHYRAAGQDALAAECAASAAERASAVLAFDRAAALYRQALELQPDTARRGEWLIGLAAALASAGRPVQAADAYLMAASATTGDQRVERQRQAAELLLMGGHIDRGLKIIASVLPVAGMRLARGPRTAVASIGLRRTALAWRGLEFEPRHASQVPRADLLRIDTCWAITTGLLLVDTLRAASIQLQHLRIALDAGEPYRVARALALEACLSAASGGRAGIARSRAFAARAETLAHQVRHPHAIGLASLTAGVAAFVLGEWTRATGLCERALTLFRDECTGVVWELTLAHNFYLGALFYRGHVRHVSHWLPALLESAREHGNLYFEAELTTRFSMVWLAADDPDTSERLTREVNARWSARGFHRQHYNHLLAQGQTALYRGRAEEAWTLADRQRTAVRRSHWHRVQIMRIETAFLEARSALAMASEGRDVPRMLAVASRASARLGRERTPWSVPMSRLVAATVAHLERNDEAAAGSLTGALDAFEAADMRLYAAVTRRRLGALVGGDRGRALRQQAEGWMATEDVRDPVAMSRLIAPGLPD